MIDHGMFCVPGRTEHRHLSGEIKCLAVHLQMFSHEKLQVYSKALDFTAQVAVLCSSWDTKHSVVDHFTRAAESIVLNLAEGARLSFGPMKLTSLDYAQGSSLECAACLDIAHLKNLLASPQF